MTSPTRIGPVLPTREVGVGSDGGHPHGILWKRQGSARVWRAQPADVARYNLLDRFRLDVELAESRQDPARHVVGLEKVNLTDGERRSWQEVLQPRHDIRVLQR